MPRTSGYSVAQIALHWAVVVLVAAQYVFKGTIAAAWDAIVAGRAYEFHPLILAHVGGGMLILVLVLARLALRVKRGAPPPPENEPAILKLLAHAVHGAFYLVLILMSVSGGMAWFRGLTDGRCGPQPVQGRASGPDRDARSGDPLPRPCPEEQRHAADGQAGSLGRGSVAGRPTSRARSLISWRWSSSPKRISPSVAEEDPFGRASGPTGRPMRRGSGGGSERCRSTAGRECVLRGSGQSPRTSG